MTIRLNQKDIARLGGAVQSRIKDAQRRSSKSRKTSSNQQKPPSTGGGRLERKEYEGTAIKIELDIAPRPKERPRTFIDDKAIIRAFMSSKGDVRTFMAKVKRKSVSEGDEASSGVMKTVTPDGTRQFEKAVTLLCQRAMAESQFEKFECPVFVLVTFCFEGDPDTWPTAQADGDLDNLEKAVLDGMNHVVYRDDRQIVVKKTQKICANKSGMSIVVRPAQPDDNI